MLIQTTKMLVGRRFITWCFFFCATVPIFVAAPYLNHNNNSDSKLQQERSSLEYDISAAISDESYTDEPVIGSDNPFTIVCKIMKKGMRFTWDNAVQCSCDESTWVVDCAVRPGKLNSCLEIEERPCTTNISASFVEQPHEGKKKDVTTTARLSKFQLCAVYPKAATPKDACVTLHYSQGNIPGDCRVTFAMVGKRGPRPCRSCRVCGKYIFSVDCQNILPNLLPRHCQMVDHPEQDFFSNLIETTTTTVVDQTTTPGEGDEPADGGGQYHKKSTSVGYKHLPVFPNWFVVMISVFLLTS